MSKSFFKLKKRPRLCEENSGKCGEITFCLQLGTRVYALNCLFCPQICIQWDAFIRHMEEEHDEELRSDHLLQQEIEEVNVDANDSKKTMPKQSSVQVVEELPQSSQICTRTEFNDGTSTEALLDYNDPLDENEAEKCAIIRSSVKKENFGFPSDQLFERVVNETTSDQTYESIDEQKTFDSIHSFSETDSDMDATNYRSPSIITNTSYVGLGQASSIFVRTFLQQLPTTQDIIQIPELQNLFKIDVLENKHRTLLAKGLISFILNRQPDRKIVKEEFLKLTQSIVEIFPSEVQETYYVPYKKGCLAKGKLFDAYNNARTRLSVAGLIRRRCKTKPEETIELGIGNTCENESYEDIDESELKILISGCAEWDLVLAMWRKTHSFRQRELRHQNLNAQEYIEKYKVLLNEKSFELFDIDYKIVYPTSNTIYNWKLYYRKVISKAEKLKDSSVKEILANINETEEEDSKLALSLMLIPYILPNPRQRTKSEIQECFISYCENTIGDGEEAGHCIKLEGQPKVYLVGDYNKTVCESFVDICGTRLKYENPLKAIDVCFQCFMVMNIKYPRYCTHVWIFIQKLIYEVITTRDAVIPAINTLINDLRLDK